MLISSNSYSIPQASYSKPQATPPSIATLAPGDVYVPSEPNAFSLGVSGAFLGMAAGGGTAIAVSQLANGFGGAALATGLVVAGGIGGAILGSHALEWLK